MSATFVTATGTAVGKTYVTAGLVRALRARGEDAAALKPVISGIGQSNFDGSDCALLLEAMGKPVNAETIARISPWRFAAPLSPDMAAAREGRQIDFEELTRFSHECMAVHRGPLLIEGVGGVMVPLTRRHTVLDWMKALDIPVLLVTGSYLGTISHTLTALEVLRRAGLKLAGLLVNESEDSGVPLGETVESLEHFGGDVPVAEIRRGTSDFAALSGLIPR